MTGYLWTPGGGRVTVTEIIVGTVGGNREVQEGWVGTTSGRKQWYRAPNQITLTGSSSNWDSVSLTWTSLAGFTYKLYRNDALIYTGTGTSYSDTGRAEKTTYNYRVDGIINGSVRRTASASVTTQAKPTDTTTQPTLALSDLQSYAKGGSVIRTNWTGTNGGSPAAAYGYWSSTWGNQFTMVKFPFPAKSRASNGCITVHSIELSWWNLHHNYNSGGQVSMAGFHHSTLGTPYGGMTGAMTLNGDQFKWSAPRGGWINGTEWYHVGSLKSTPYNITFNEEVRTNNLQGFCLIPAASGQAGYGYAARNPRCRIKYTYRV